MSSGTKRWWVGAAGSALLVSLMSACGSSQPGSEAGSKAATRDTPSQTKESAPMPVKETVFGDMAGAEDRAKGVEKTAKEQKEALDRAVEQNEGSTPAE